MHNDNVVAACEKAHRVEKADMLYFSVLKFRPGTKYGCVIENLLRGYCEGGCGSNQPIASRSSPLISVPSALELPGDTG